MYIVFPTLCVYFVFISYFIYLTTFKTVHSWQKQQQQKNT